MAAARDRESRRKFLNAVPAAVAGAVATKALAQGQGGQAAGPVKPETIDCAREDRRPRLPQ